MRTGLRSSSNNSRSGADFGGNRVVARVHGRPEDGQTRDSGPQKLVAAEIEAIHGLNV